MAALELKTSRRSASSPLNIMSWVTKSTLVCLVALIGVSRGGMPYSFSYSVSDASTSNHQVREERSDGDTVTGFYQLLLPDGRTQIVKFRAGHSEGFNADVRFRAKQFTPSPRDPTAPSRQKQREMEDHRELDEYGEPMAIFVPMSLISHNSESSLPIYGVDSKERPARETTSSNIDNSFEDANEDDEEKKRVLQPIAITTEKSKLTKLIVKPRPKMRRGPKRSRLDNLSKKLRDMSRRVVNLF